MITMPWEPKIIFGKAARNKFQKIATAESPASTVHELEEIEHEGNKITAYAIQTPDGRTVSIHQQGKPKFLVINKDTDLDKQVKDVLNQKTTEPFELTLKEKKQHAKAAMYELHGIQLQHTGHPGAEKHSTIEKKFYELRNQVLTDLR